MEDFTEKNAVIRSYYLWCWLFMHPDKVKSDSPFAWNMIANKVTHGCYLCDYDMRGDVSHVYCGVACPLASEALCDGEHENSAYNIWKNIHWSGNANIIDGIWTITPVRRDVIDIVSSKKKAAKVAYAIRRYAKEKKWLPIPA